MGEIKIYLQKVREVKTRPLKGVDSSSEKYVGLWESLTQEKKSDHLQLAHICVNLLSLASNVFVRIRSVEFDGRLITSELESLTFMNNTSVTVHQPSSLVPFR